MGLNPLGIGEGFELKLLKMTKNYWLSLNPLGIGEGFEQDAAMAVGVFVEVLIP